MSFTATTLSAALGANDTSMTVASATNFAAGQLARVDQEFVRVSKTYTSGTVIPLDGRGLNGTTVVAHVVTANVVTTPTITDWANAAPQGGVPYPITSPGRVIQSITADNSTVTLPTAGNDLTVILNGTSVIHLTVPVPTKDMDGSELLIVGNGAAAHVVTFTGGLSGAGTSYDAITVNATAPIALRAVACNGLWVMPIAPAMTGTVTNITGGIA